LLLERSEPTESEVISRMNGNLCRCGAHPRIVQAIMSAVQMIKGGAK
jgi:aerobic-type carbon monoxide dehydrogenase small subunit (CoxS/CutS family)